LIIFFDIVVCHDKINVAIYLVCGGLYFMLNKKTTLLTLFSTIAVMSLFSIGRTPLGPLNVEGEGLSTLTTVSVSVQPNLLNFTNRPTSITYRAITSFVDNIAETNRKFDINTNSRLNTNPGSYLLLPGNGYSSGDYGTSEDAFYILTESGSNANKYVLTGLTIVGSRRVASSPAETPVTITLDKITSATPSEFNEDEEEILPGSIITSGSPFSVGTFNSAVISGLTNSDLDSQTFSINQDFEYSDDITTFRLRSSHSFYYSSIVFEYSIDYSSC
jgi:hypothetical protein